MKYEVIFLVMIVAVAFIPHVFAYDQKLFYGKSSLEKIPDTIIPDTEYQFEIKFQYTESEYWLRNIHPSIEIGPSGAAPYVHINAERISTMPLSVSRTPVTLQVDSEIPYDKIFLSISYVSENSSGEQLRSAWSDSVIIDIRSDDKQTSYSEFLSYCKESESMDWTEMTDDQKGLANLCDFVGNGLTEEYWNWIGPTLDWRNFAQNISEKYAESIPLFVEKGRPDSLVVITSVSGRDSFPPGMYANVSFFYDEDNKTKRFFERYMLNISGEFVETKDNRAPPLQLYKQGFWISEIKCKENLVLVEKHDGSPACVKPETKEKLIERGWITLDDNMWRELYNMGCSDVIISHLEKYSNLFDEKFDGTYNLEDIGLPNGISQSKLDQCAQLILENRLDEASFKIIGLDKYYHPDEPLSISIEKTGYNMCDGWNAKIIDYSSNSTVWQRDYFTSCVTLTPPKIQKFVYEVTNQNHPIMLSSIGDYSFQIDIGGVHLEKDIVIRQNMSGVSLDRPIHPSPSSELFDYEIVRDNVTYGSQYRISGGNVTDVQYNKQSNSIILSLNPSGNGTVEIVLPTGLLHQVTAPPFSYFVLENGEEIAFEQESPVILRISFDSETYTIEIIGTKRI